MQIGPYSLHVIETCRFKLDGGAIFGSVPKPIWNRQYPADDLNRIELAARALLLRGNARTILIDTGLGTKLGSKDARICGLDTSRFEIRRSLEQYGVALEDVTDVILTHLHFDHAGGATSMDGKIAVPMFPKAMYHVQKAHWQHALKPTEKDRAGFVSADFAPLLENGVLNFVDGPTELLPHISLAVFNGHTPAQQLPLISFEGRTIFFSCDLFPTTAHLKLPYISANDLWPIKTMEEKKEVLEQASAEKWVLIFSHDPRITAGSVRKSDKGFELIPGSVDL